ncbi:MAG: family efflux transporter subunit [Candidatus Nomurabacteria bacterium]|nr:family efflux transporter subunit [Candidatus Nomurabacteria bacterium]
MKSIKQWWSTASTKKKIITGVGLLVVISIIFLLTKGGSSEEVSATAQQGDVVSSVVLSGMTSSASAVSLGFADQGRVGAVYVKEGDKVRAGQVLASIDSADLSASLKSAQAALVIANANNINTSTNLATITAQQDTLVNNAHKALLSNHLQAVPKNLTVKAPAPTVTGTYDGEEGQYFVHVYASGSSSGASFTVSGLENNGTQEAATTTAVPLGSRGLYIQFDPTGTYGGSDWIVSIPNPQSATYTADRNAYNAAIAARTQAIAAAEASLKTNSTAQSVASAQIAQAQASVDAIRASIAKRQIIAPFNGVVAGVNVKPGQTTSSFNTSASTGESGNANISVISENDYEVVLKTPEIDVASIAVGQPVSLSLDAFDKETFPGIITSINPAETIVDGVPVYQTKVSFTKLDPRIRSGMSATATINVGQKINVITIPASYVHTDDRGSYVYVLKDKKTTQKAVTTGLRGSDSAIEIMSGLNAGDVVVLNKK